MKTDRRTVLKGLLSGLTLAGCAGQDADDEASGTPVDLPPLRLTQQPWVQITGATTARLRCESREPLPLTLTLSAGTTEGFTAETVELDYLWDAGGGGPDDFLPDEPGPHHLHTASLTGLPAGVRIEWTLKADGFAPRTGSFRAPPAPGEATTLGWLADTMWPNNIAVSEGLAAEGPELVLHGGDIQYQTSPYDTWRGVSHTFAPLTAQAPMHFAVGNHEFEAMEEITVYYERLHAGQGETGAPRYHGFSWGPVRVIVLDSESGNLADGNSEQIQWLQQELDAANDAGLRPLIAFHRPVFTFSKHFPSTDVRDQLHPRFLAAGVPVVLMGHAHCYERFEVDGIQYITDGGGGALSYDPDEDLEKMREERPEEEALRVFVTRSYGYQFIEIDPDGTLSGRRVEAETGEVQDTWQA